MEGHNEGRCNLSLRMLGAILVSLAFIWGAEEAEAGAIRFAGKKVRQGSTAVAGVTAATAQAAGGGVAIVGKTTGGVIKTGVVATGKGAKATPALAARGAKAMAKGLARAIW